jgi:hypothetical protein
LLLSTSRLSAEGAGPWPILTQNREHSNALSAAVHARAACLYHSRARGGVIPQVKRERKIFFVFAWLGAFIGGQQSAVAEGEVQDWLKTSNIDRDLRLKVLEVVDELDRTVRILQRYP